MKNNIKHIKKILNKFELNYEFNKKGNFFAMLHQTSLYLNADDENWVIILVRIQEKGKVISFVAPELYTLNNIDYLPEVSQTFLWAQSQSMFLRYDYDANDGEITAKIDLPLLDTRLSAHQFYRAHSALLSFIDVFDESIKSAVISGEQVRTLNLSADTPVSKKQLEALKASQTTTIH